jgi:hypothetical protein
MKRDEGILNLHEMLDEEARIEIALEDPGDDIFFIFAGPLV